MNARGFARRASRGESGDANRHSWSAIMIMQHMGSIIACLDAIGFSATDRGWELQGLLGSFCLALRKSCVKRWLHLALREAIGKREISFAATASIEELAIRLCEAPAISASQNAAAPLSDAGKDRQLRARNNSIPLISMEVAQLIVAGPGADIGQIDQFFTQRLNLPAMPVDPISALTIDTGGNVTPEERSGLGIALGLGMREVA